MAYSLTQLEAIEDAIASGHTRVTYDGKTVEYRSLKEMMQIRDTIRDALGLNPCGSDRRVTPMFSKGLC